MAASSGDWRAGDDHYDTDALTLDVVLSGDGDVSMKDEDEVQWAEREGNYAPATATKIRRIGDAASKDVEAGH